MTMTFSDVPKPTSCTALMTVRCRSFAHSCPSMTTHWVCPLLALLLFLRELHVICSHPADGFLPASFHRRCWGIALILVLPYFRDASGDDLPLRPFVVR
ncbi:hypothetical protein BD309DRAFT_395814 [Dichomitus squalens]|nr:hypothetical protein BD309DRAFT_395814 [Dichomitus squalens]